MLGPTLERLEKESGWRWRLVTINSDMHADLERRYGVRAIPAIQLWAGAVPRVVDGAVAADSTGALPEAEVRR